MELIAVEGIGELGPGDSLAAEIGRRIELVGGDVVCVSQKAVSKVEGRVRELDGVQPSARARELAEKLERDPRLIELVLAESRRVVRADRRALIVETNSGLVCANAGIDASNVPGEHTVALLPLDPDASARRLRAELESHGSAPLGVVIADSFGRPWRLGQTDVAIGCAGLQPLDDWRGRRDAQGRELAATAVAVADQIAAAADLARDKISGTPAIIARGLGLELGADGDGARALQRVAEEDLFR